MYFRLADGRHEGLPVSLFDAEGHRKRLLGLDKIGLVPHYDSLHRANQHFHEKDEVWDVLHYDELGRYKRRADPLITWVPLPVMRPRN